LGRLTEWTNLHTTGRKTHHEKKDPLVTSRKASEKTSETKGQEKKPKIAE